MNWGKLVSVILATGVICWLVIPIAGLFAFGNGDATGVTVLVVSVFLVWPAMIWWSYNRK